MPTDDPQTWEQRAPVASTSRTPLTVPPSLPRLTQAERQERATRVIVGVVIVLAVLFPLFVRVLRDSGG